MLSYRGILKKEKSRGHDSLALVSVFQFKAQWIRANPLLFGVILLVCSCGSGENQATQTGKSGEIQITDEAKKPWDVVLVREPIIYFRNQEILRTYLYDLKYIGQLQSGNKAPYLIMSGRSCKDCDENTSIYIHSPDDGEMKSYGEQPRYSYPGKEYDYLTNDLVFESRMLFGDCLQDYPNSVVWIQKFINDQNDWEKSTFIVQVHNEKLREINIVDESIFNEVEKSPSCQELEGIDTVSEP